MAKASRKNKIRPSILDRLLDNNPNSNVDGDQDQYQKTKDLRNSVRRDLENLLNTRLRVVEPGDEYKELAISLLNYGMPDLATINIADQEKRKQFIEQLETMLIEFEPRFKSVSIHYQENADRLDRSLRFRIDAVLYADPSPEIVVFDSVLEPVSRTVNIEEAHHV